MHRRKLALTVALDWPRTSAEAAVFQDALEAVFAETKEKMVRGPSVGLSITIYSATLPGNRPLPRIWRRMLRYLQNTKVLSPAVDPWCYGLRVHELETDADFPRVDLLLIEE